MILAAFFILIFLIYTALIIVLIFGISRFKQVSEEKIKHEKGFSIVVPFRNEAKNLPALLRSVSNLDYPGHLFELILINDNSEDDYIAVLDNFRRNNPELNFQLLHIGPDLNSPKKEAIQLAVKHSKHEWIITTDADCIVPEEWLRAYSDYSIDEIALIAGPVLYQRKSGIIPCLQYYDYLALQGLSMGGYGIGKPFLCSGANLAFSKFFFRKLDGFAGNLDIASGDDLFILKKTVDQDPKKAAFLKDKTALVLTRPLNSFNSLLNQRLRWIAKTKRVGNPVGTLVSIIGLLANVSLPLGLLIVISGGLNWQFFLFGLILKMVSDFILIFKTAKTFEQKIVTTEILLISFSYPLFVLSIVLRSVFPLFQWKGRAYNA